jgi:UMF1 family MFS transporter
MTKCVLTMKKAFWFLALLIGLPFPIMMLVDVDRGRADGLALTKKLETLANQEDENEETDCSARDVEQE